MKFIGCFIGLLSFFWSITVFSQEKDYQADTALIHDYYKKMEMLRYDYQDSSIYYANKIVDLAKKHNLQGWVANAYMGIAMTRSVQGEYVEALKMDLRALEIARNIQDSSLLLVVYNNIGDDQLNIKSYEDAYNNFLEAREIARKKGYVLNEAIATFNLGLILMELQQYDSAIYKFRESYNMSLKANDKEGEAYVFSKLGNIYTQMADYDSALYYLRKARKESRDHNLPDVEGEILEYLGETYIELENYEEAKKALDSSLLITRKLQNRSTEARVLNTKASLNNILGDLKAAENLAQQSLEIAREEKLGDIMYNSFRILAEIYEKRGNSDQSLEYYKKYSHVRDSVTDKIIVSRINSLQLQSEIKKRDFEINLLNTLREQRRAELDKQETLRNILVVVLAFMTLILITLFRSGSRRRRVNKLLDQSRKEAELRNKELDELNKVKDKFISILAHDLRSPIRSLSGILQLAESDKLSEKESRELLKNIKNRTEHTARLLDNLLEWALLQMDRVTVNKSEFDINKLTEDNIDLLIDTTPKKISVSNNTPSVQVFADRNMIDLAMRNLLSNAVKFTGEGGEIDISLEMRDKDVVISISDNGLGMSEEEKNNIFDEKNVITKSGTSDEKGTGLGLKLCKEFIEKNGGEIWVESEKNKGSTFYFSLPKN